MKSSTINQYKGRTYTRTGLIYATESCVCVASLSLICEIENILLESSRYSFSTELLQPIFFNTDCSFFKDIIDILLTTYLLNNSFNILVLYI